MSSSVVVEKYAKALFEVALASADAQKIFSELEVVAGVFSQKESVEFFSSPFNTDDTKQMAAKATLEGRCSHEVFNFIITLVQNGRAHLVSEINLKVQSLARAQSGETEGVLYFANDLAADFIQQVETKISATLNKKVKLQTKKDPNLLSGYKVTVGGWTIDDSAQFHLNKLKDDLSKRGI